MSRWQEELLACCDDCTSPTTSNCIQQNDHHRHHYDPTYKRFMTIGPVRYGMRVGAVSPPPPGAGPRYRSQCCWPTTPCSNNGGYDSVGPVSRIPLLTTTPINSLDIISCANRMRISENATSDQLLAQQTSATTVRDHVLHTGKSLLKTQLNLKRCALVRPQVYTRLTAADYGEINGKLEDNTLDRLPRFRFGGNRSGGSDKRTNEQRLKDLTDRLKRGTVPIPPPRNRHNSRTTPPISPQPTQDIVDYTTRITPLRSASFSQVDYCPDDNKYVRRKHSPIQTDCNHKNNDGNNQEQPNVVSTLPRSKNLSRTTSTTEHNTAGVSVIQPEFCAPDICIGSSENNSVDNLNESKTLQQQQQQIPITRTQDNTTTPDKKRDKSKRRKGIYIAQYNPSENVLPQFMQDSDIANLNKTTKLLEDSLAEISKLQDDKKDFPIWSSPQEEPLSPEENTTPPEWPKNTNSYIRKLDDKDLLKVRDASLFRSDSLSEGETDGIDKKSDHLSSHIASDLSDCESRLGINSETNIPKRYSKRPLRGPYGQMLEAEMKKPEIRKNINSDLKFLEDLSSSTASLKYNNTTKTKQTRTRGSCNSSLDETNYLSSPTQQQQQQQSKRKVSADSLVVANNEIETKLVVSHQRTTSSPSKLECINNEVSSELLEQLLIGSSEHLTTNDANQQQQNDTRTHVVVELYENETSYVEALQILVTKYLEPLKSPENANLLDAALVDEIFYQIPFLLSHHQSFLDELKKRLEHWDIKQKIGDVFLEMFSKSSIIESYTNYVNNWKKAREIIKNAQQSKPAFSRFLEITARGHKGKLALDSLLIKPIQKFPKYELLLQRLIKHTDVNHPDHSLLLAAQRQVHEQLLKINCTEKETLELEQLREIEGLIEGLIELVSSDRQYIRHDLVTMAAEGGTRKERALFLFSDLLLITSIKRRSGTIRRPITVQGSVTSTLEANKYKLLMKISLDDLEIVRTRDDNLRQMMIEVDNLTEDINILNQINELSWSLHCNHTQLDEVIKDMLSSLNKQLSEQQNSDSQLSQLDLTINTTNGLENISIIFPKAEKRTSWEESFNEVKQKLAMSSDRKPSPELLATVPIRKTRAGLQFTCAAPTLSENGKDVWVCNSDGYVGQVCVLSLQPEPTVTSCNGVCNARILCIASVPGINNGLSVTNKGNNNRTEGDDHKTMQFDSGSSSDEDDKSDSEHNDEPQRIVDNVESSTMDLDETDNQQSTMWLGTEDGCIHVYNSGDNIRIKKNKIRLQHSSSILCIIYLDNRVFVSLANGDIIIYDRESSGGWNINLPTTVTVGSTTTPVSKMLPNSGKLWCGCGSTIKVLNTNTLIAENNFTVNNDNNKPITSIVLCGNGVWLSLQNSAIIKCFHGQSFEPLCEINVAPAVTKMLTSCDDIIRQHKAACLRVTALVACKDLLWIGTSAGVLLTMPLPHITSSTTKLINTPTVNGVSHGHTGHVRFLTTVEMHYGENQHRNSYKGKTEQRSNTKLLVISGGDGYEDFRTSNISEVAGREDSTNHLLLWNI